jgi:hypothetical protein
VEHLAGVRCPECPAIVTIRVNVQQHPSAGGPYESVELDMTEVWTHATCGGTCGPSATTSPADDLRHG